MGMPAAKCADKTLQDFVNNIQIPCNAQEGDKPCFNIHRYGRRYIPTGFCCI